MTLPQLIPPPANPGETGSSKAWEKLEARLGLSLPDDYKSLIDTYGMGSFGGLITVYNPFAHIEEFNLLYVLDTLHQADRQTQLLRGSGWTAVTPFELYPAPGGLLPWGCAATFGDTFFWKVSGPPQSWETIFYHLRSGEYEVWKMSITEFIAGILSGKVKSVLLPEDSISTDEVIHFIPQ
jgi:hypothetical protein